MAEVKGLLYVVRWHTGAEIAELAAFCPACDFVHGFRVDLVGHGKWERQSGKRDIWTFNGDYEAPTFNPSMLSNRGQSVYAHHPACHSFLTNGVWNYLNDCTHAMAGQKVPVPPPDPDMNFERRHGWHLFPWCDPVTGEPLKTDG